MAIHCTQCGLPLPVGTKFCTGCGKGIVTPTRAPIPRAHKILAVCSAVILITVGIAFGAVFPFLAKRGIAILPIYTGTISGSVYKTDGITPLEGALVQIQGTIQTGKSDSTGKFYLFDIPVGKYVVGGQYPGHQSASVSIRVTYKANSDISLTLPVDPAAGKNRLLAEKLDPVSRTSEIWIMDLDGSRKQRLAQGTSPEVISGGAELVLTRDGKRYQINIDGSGEQLVGVAGGSSSGSGSGTNSGSNQSEVSPDKTTTAVIEAGDIWITTGTNKKRITNLSDNEISRLYWINSDKILFSGRQGGNAILKVVDTKSGQVTQVYSDTPTPQISPDHQYFLVHKYASGFCFWCSDQQALELTEKQKQNGIWVYKSLDGTPWRVTRNLVSVYRDIEWISGSSYLTYRAVNTEGGDAEGFYLADAGRQGSEGKQIISGSSNIDFSGAVWSQKKDSLITSSGYLVKLDGSPARQVTDRRASFTWLPSGRLLFVYLDDKTTWISDGADNQKKISDFSLDLDYSLSGDGSTILTGGGGYIWTMSANGDNINQITTETGYSHPQWVN